MDLKQPVRPSPYCKPNRKHDPWRHFRVRPGAAHLWALTPGEGLAYPLRAAVRAGPGRNDRTVDRGQPEDSQMPGLPPTGAAPEGDCRIDPLLVLLPLPPHPAGPNFWEVDCALSQSTFPHALDCAFYQPPPPPETNAETGLGYIWDCE